MMRICCKAAVKREKEREIYVVGSVGDTRSHGIAG